MKTYGQDESIGLDQDVLKTSGKRLKRPETKNVFKTSSRQLHQDACLLGYVTDNRKFKPSKPFFSDTSKTVNNIIVSDNDDKILKDENIIAKTLNDYLIN